MTTITTKFLGPTNNRGARYKAFDDDGHNTTLYIDHALNSEQNHNRAAIALCKKMGWEGPLFSGDISKGQKVYIFYDYSNVIEVPLDHDMRVVCDETANLG